ncbi:MAG: hypothetical protein MAGBODY4_00585 [Candidatus Marinimicrobia bacterium]|nr:hypothetical protein [Candidatus Neomarinimicrobiota bacterium]
MKVDAEKGNGVDLAEQFHVRGYPTTVFVNADGKEIDRVVGYLPVEKWLDEIQRIDQGKNTYASLEKKLEESPNNVDVLMRFAKKVRERNRQSERIPKIWNQVQELSQQGSENYVTAVYKVAEYDAMTQGNPEPLKVFLNEYPEASQRSGAWQTLVRIYRSQKKTDQEATAFRRATDEAIEAGKASPGLLNSYAWRMAELETNLQDALDKAEKAVELVGGEDPKTQAQIMDTKAEVLWKLDRVQEAVQVINKCIELAPEDDYFQKQKSKFLGESAEA